MEQKESYVQRPCGERSQTWRVQGATGQGGWRQGRARGDACRTVS